jgi:LPS export ABC transporter permease LptG/LPS export ABC transporter permease LptF
MFKVERYIFREALIPVGLGFLVYTFILLMQVLFNAAEMIIRRGVPAEQIGHFVLLTLPNVVVLTIPMALPFGILVAVGRLSSDSELIAMRASGVSLKRLYAPILALSILLTLITGYLSIQVMPRTNHEFARLRLDILARSLAKQVEPRVFYEEWEGLMLYVFDFDALRRKWSGVFLTDSLPKSANKVTVADRGEVKLDESGEKLVLYLDNAVVHDLDFRKPKDYAEQRSASWQQILETDFTSRRKANASISRGLRELTLPELRQNLRKPDLNPQIRYLTEVEIHKKFSIPAACLAFGLIALPLGITKLRGARASGFAVSVGLIVVYWMLIKTGEETAATGHMAPWLAMWLPNIALSGLGIYFLYRKNQELPLLPNLLGFLLPLRSGRTTKVLKSSASAKAGLGTAAAIDPSPPGSVRRREVVLRVPRWSLRFPNLLDRYIFSSFVSVLVMVMLSCVAIYVVADLTDKADEILKSNLPTGLIFDYYKYQLFQMSYNVSPIAVLVTTLVTFGLMAQRNEVVAAKALGVSLYRLAVPVVIAASLVVGLSVYLEATILPAANEKVARIKNRLKGVTTRGYRRADRNWLFGQGKYIYNYLRYDSATQTLYRLQVFEFDDDNHLIRRLFADSAQYEGDSWIFKGSWTRSFVEGDEKYQSFDTPVRGNFPETPAYFETDIKPAQAMTYRELETYLEELRNSGQPRSPELEVKLHEKIALPAVSLVMALVALPFAFRLGKRGALYGVSIGIVLGFVYYAIFVFFSTLGTTDVLPPPVAVWSSNVLFAVLSMYLFLGVKT